MREEAFCRLKKCRSLQRKTPLSPHFSSKKERGRRARARALSRRRRRLVIMIPRRSKIALQLGKGDARDQQTREPEEKTRKRRSRTPWRQRVLNIRRHNLVNELQKLFPDEHEDSNALVVLVSGDKRSSEHDWAAICVDMGRTQRCKGTRI